MIEPEFRSNPSCLAVFNGDQRSREAHEFAINPSESNLGTEATSPGDVICLVRPGQA